MMSRHTGKPRTAITFVNILQDTTAALFPNPALPEVIASQGTFSPLKVPL